MQKEKINHFEVPEVSCWGRVQVQLHSLGRKGCSLAVVGFGWSNWVCLGIS